MIEQNIVSMKMEKIKTIFQTSKDFALEQHADINAVVAYLEQTDLEFRSVAYEGASMALVLTDFKNGNNLNRWRIFAEGVGKNHAAQIHTGLGWALAQEGKSALSFNDTFKPLMRYRVIDGFGYYEGVFRQRSTIKNQKLPIDLNGIALECYVQGLGRSIWYSSKGDFKLVIETINKFDSSRHKNLWRGIGIACAYVGGLTEQQLKKLFLLVDSYQPQLASAAVLVAKNRFLSNTIVSDTELVCKQWCNASVIEAFAIAEKCLPTSSENAYENWILAIEKEFASSEILNS